MDLLIFFFNFRAFSNNASYVKVRTTRVWLSAVSRNFYVHITSVISTTFLTFLPNYQRENVSRKLYLPYYNRDKTSKNDFKYYIWLWLFIRYRVALVCTIVRASGHDCYTGNWSFVPLTALHITHGNKWTFPEGNCLVSINCDNGLLSLLEFVI